MAFIDYHFWAIELVLTTALIVPKQLKSCSLEVFLSNNLVALARLGGRTMSCAALNIAVVGNACMYYLGGFYRYNLSPFPFIPSYSIYISNLYYNNIVHKQHIE